MNAIAAHKQSLFDRVLKAVIIYDDFDSAAHATALLERVARRTDEAIKWDLKPWRLEVLKQPTLAALTVAVAANADLIVLALNHPHPPLAELRDWLTSWAKHRRTGDAAVVALCPEKSHPQSAFQDEIKAFAEAYNLTYLGNHHLSNGGNSASFVHHLQQQKRRVEPASPSPLAEPLPAPRPGGGNE
jgi:hypothetical protein